MSGVMLRYDGIGIGSNKSFSVSSVSDKENFSKDADILNREAAYQNYGNPCDLYSVSLDGSVAALPENTENISVGLWSETQTDENGRFLTPIVVSMVSDEYFTTAGITLKFDTNKGIFANDLLIEWYRDDAKITEKAFAPESAEPFCSNRVEMFNRVDITFYGLNAPKNRLRLQGVEFGIATDFTARSLKNSAIKQSFSPISETLPINTLNFSIISRDGIDFAFEERQPIEAYFNESLKGLFFVKNAKQSGEGIYSVNCEDYIGILEDATFDGGVYEDYNTAYLIRDICGKAGVPVVVPPEIEGTYLISGYLPRGTCRKALQQVLFSLQLYADTSGFGGLKIKKATNKGQRIPRTRIMQGINIAEEKKVTEVQILAHSYVLTDEEVVLYDAKESGAGTGIEVVFSEPYLLTLENGELIEWSRNHAVFNANEKTLLKGKKYNHTTILKSKKNPLLLSSDKKNIIRIENATLVTLKNIDSILDFCYDYFMKMQRISAKIVEGKHESEQGYIYDDPVSLGDVLTLETAFKGEVSGMLESQSFSMNGGILVKECILK